MSDLADRLRDLYRNGPKASWRDDVRAACVVLDALNDPRNKAVLSCWSPVTHDAYGDGTPVERDCLDCPPCRIALALADGDDMDDESPML